MAQPYSTPAQVRELLTNVDASAVPDSGAGTRNVTACIVLADRDVDQAGARGGYDPAAFAATVDFVTQLSRLRAAYYLMLVMHPVGALPAFAEEYRRLTEERLAQLSGGEVVLAGNSPRERLRYKTANE